MSGGTHCEIYPALDPVAVARIAEGYGIEAALELWAPWSPKAISKAASRGRRMLSKLPPAAGPGQPAGVHGRPQFSDSASIKAVFGRSGPRRRCPSHS